MQEGRISRVGQNDSDMVVYLAKLEIFDAVFSGSGGKHGGKGLGSCFRVYVHGVHSSIPLKAISHLSIDDTVIPT